MSILALIIVGGIIGWLASVIAGRREGILGSIVIGIIGSFIGTLLSRLFNSDSGTFLAFSWASFFWSLIGAIILVAIMNAVSHRHHHTTI